MDIEILKQIYNARKTIYELCDVRNYKIDCDRNQSFEKTFSVLKKEATKREIEEFFDKLDIYGDNIVIFWTWGKINSENIAYYTKKLEKLGISRSIIVVENTKSVSSQTRTTIKNLTKLANKKLVIDIFNYPELQFNITKHAYVPKHEILTDKDEIREIIRCYEKEQFLQKIRKDDPVIKFIGAKKGDFIKITRKQYTSKREIIEGKTTINYRIVISAK